MTLTIYTNREDQDQNIAHEWGYDDNGEWKESYRRATKEDIEAADDHVFAHFPGYAVATPKWEDLLGKL